MDALLLALPARLAAPQTPRTLHLDTAAPAGSDVIARRRWSGGLGYGRQRGGWWPTPPPAYMRPCTMPVEARVALAFSPGVTTPFNGPQRWLYIVVGKEVIQQDKAVSPKRLKLGQCQRAMGERTLPVH